MVSTEPVPEAPRGPGEGQPCHHVVLKPTPKRLRGGLQPRAGAVPRGPAAFGSAGTGAFTAYVPRGSDPWEPGLQRRPDHPAGDPPTVVRLSPLPRFRDPNDDGQHQPIDLRNDSKRFGSARLGPSLDREPSAAAAVQAGQRVLDDVGHGGAALPPHRRHETVIARSALPQVRARGSGGGLEYMRYTVRNNNARAEVFEMRRSYATSDAVLPRLGGCGVLEDRGSCCSEDEDIDVVGGGFDDGGGSPVDDSSCSSTAKDGDSDSCEGQPLDCRLRAPVTRSSSPSSEEVSSAPPTSGSPSSSDPLPSPGCDDPQDAEAWWGVFAPEDLLLRNRVLLLLWFLLGEARLAEVGYPRAPVHRVLWLTVDVCCSVAGMKSAAAVPLASDHDCREDMLCFRDHTHRFLEVCAPTRDMWKQLGWAGLTVDAVVRKIYEEELRPRLCQLPASSLPPAIRGALRRLDRLEAAPAEVPGPPPPPPRRRQPPPPQAAKKKRGRPAKPGHKTDPGRIERVMLWRFLLNLLEDPRNRPCIHWVQRDEGIFRILNTDWLARLWGRRHGNPRMTYEKMARAMRTYYRSKVLQPVPRTRNLPRKLIYKFNPAVIHKDSKHAPFSDRGLNYNTAPGS
ncbi:uncharacterized protein LOC134531788 [Bacillus rossius redtenbacheri]|uniref:uncharacterized protein LOC134531788 n=1 Tax=Bacillus rossius redtenbacheri TaxID=93214 RepID=UPI002FDDEA5B